MELRTSSDVVTAAAEELERALTARLADAERCSLALSGGSSPGPVFERLAAAPLDWERVDVFQVDERVAPDGDDARNLTGQQVTLLDRVPCRTIPMPVTAPDLDAAARRYADALPSELDVVHLGLGDDGHTASWPPGDPVVDSPRPCELVGEFNGFRRMTLTPPVINAARARLMLAYGSAKAPMLARWLLRDPDLPVDRVRRSDTWTFLDQAAAELLPGSG